MLNPVLPAPRSRIQTARNVVDVILNARSAADLRLYGWEKGQATADGRFRWKGTEEHKGQYRTQKTEPGTGRGKKAQGDATAGAAEGKQPAAKHPAQKKQAAPRKPKVDHNEVGDRIEKMLGSDFPDQDVGALREELLSLTGTQLAELQKRFTLKGGRTKADRAGRIAGHVGGSRKKGEQPAPEAAPAPEKPARKPRAAKQPVRQPEPTPEPGKPGGRYDDMTREQIYDELAKGNLQNRKREDQPLEGFLNPRGYEGFPEGIDADAVTSSTVDAVRKATAGKYGSPNIRKMFEDVKASHPDLTLDQFQQTLTELHRQKKIRLGAYGQAPSTIPDDQIRYVFPLDGEPKMFVGLGANAGQVKPPQPKQPPVKNPPAAAPTPEPETESMDLLDDGDYGDSMDLADESEPPFREPEPTPAPTRQAGTLDEAHAQRQAEPEPSPAQKQAASRAIFDAVGDEPVVDISELRSKMPRHLQGRAFDDAVIDLLDSREAMASQDSDPMNAKPGHIRDGGSVLSTLTLDRQSQRQTPPPAAAPTPAPTPAPAPQKEPPRTPNAVTRNRLTAGVKPSVLPAGKPQAKRTGRGILNARNPVDVVLFARSPQQARPLLYAWLRTASKRNPGKTVWVNSTNPKDRRYQEHMPKQRATQAVESLPPRDHLRQILEAPYRVADYYLTSLQTRLRRMRPGALAALRMQFDTEG